MIDETDLLRFLEGDCSPDEAAVIQQWIAADPRRGELLDDLRSIWRLTGDTTRRWDVVEARRRLQRVRRQTSWWAWLGAMRLAATIAALISGAVLWYLRPQVTPFREYATAPGQWSQLSFPDGSRVLLGVATRLRVPRDYGVRERTVDLEGEAYFIVRHDLRRPFRVRTERGTTEDLGTEFDVRAYPQEHLQVVVAAGRVAFRGRDSVPMTLQPRERAVIDARGVATRTTGVRLESYLAWTRGILLFDDAPLRVVLAQLERWYDLDIQAGDGGLDDDRLTISFTTETAEEALRALAKVLDVRVTRTGRRVRFTADHPQQ